MAEILKKIGSIEILDADREIIRDLPEVLDVARNGKFYLVENLGQDAYGNPIYKAKKQNDKFTDSLIQVIGRLIVERDDLAAKLSSAVRTKAD